MKAGKWAILLIKARSTFTASVQAITFERDWWVPHSSQSSIKLHRLKV